MSDQPAPTTAAPDAPPSPGQRSEAAADAAAQAAQVPSPAASPVEASAALVADTEHDPAVVSGPEADALAATADAEATMPPPPSPAAPDGPAPAAPVTVAGGTGEVEVECPGCGLVVVGDSPRPTAAWFCPRCDYPLFWASPPPPDQPPSGRARRRLPGTGGRTVVGAEACWYCGEMNEPGTTACFRCAATLPKPPPPQVEAVLPPTELVPAPYPVPFPTVSWPYVTAALFTGLAAGITVTTWLLGSG